MSLLGCDHFEHIFEDTGARSKHSSYEFLYPIIFNFKHGLELYIKGLGAVDSHGEYDGNHDLRKLLEENVKKSIGTPTSQIWDTLKNNIWDTVSKYYYGTYLDNVDSNAHPDTKNEAERYPEQTNRTCYKIEDIYKFVDNEFILNVKSDINTVKSFLEQAKRDIRELNR
jgi:HEPN domain-containing protein